jgi:hypothetical protein
MKLTAKEGYEAMLHMLNDYWELTGSNDLTDILSGGEYLSDGTPADPVFLQYWMEAVEKVKNGTPPLTKKLME